jgi:hypothetical protein
MTSGVATGAVVVEVRGRQVGLLVPETPAYRFYAAVPEAVPLDGARYRSLARGEAEVARHLRGPRADRR